MGSIIFFLLVGVGVIINIYWGVKERRTPSSTPARRALISAVTLTLSVLLAALAALIVEENIAWRTAIIALLAYTAVMLVFRFSIYFIFEKLYSAS
jgi:hypothetical protein